jgi:hypothetical protein
VRWRGSGLRVGFVDVDDDFGVCFIMIPLRYELWSYVSAWNVLLARGESCNLNPMTFTLFTADS